MLCVTGGERSCRELASRLRAFEREPLQEVRLDLLDDLDDSTYPLLRRPDLVVTCRSAVEGGGFRGSEGERLAVLRRALHEQPGYLDVELGVEPAAWRALVEGRGRTQLIGSHHVLTAGADVAACGRALAALPAQILKLAVMVDDAAELLSLLALETDRTMLRIGIGAAGLLSRALPSRFGSPWTYVHADSAPPTAAGQLGVEQARALRIDDEASLQPLFLVGGEQVMRSPGPLVYNRLFARRAMPYLYLPAIGVRAAELLALIERLGARGASVTMPLKEGVLGTVDELVPPADRIGAVNTIRLDRGRRRAWNSDADAIGTLCGEGGGRSALVLGAGGAARAAVAALGERGWSVSVTARDRDRALRLAVSTSTSIVPWQERARGREPLVVNATPCDDPLVDRVDWSDATVLDLVLSGVSRTPLLERAAAGGARTISGLAMWIEQGARQMSWLLETTIEAAELEACLS